GMSVPYALADIGGFLGIGANTIAIPWDRLTIAAEQEEFVLAATQEQLEQAPTIDVDAIETEGFANQVEIDTFWQGLDAGGDDTGSGDDTGASGSIGAGGDDGS
ncbi:MAG: PRC-barrel domain containing protein, partial [Chloroflexi bacterium]|nr:PRC-barrel domain containing protein [Chloroflexota bacterium]